MKLLADLHISPRRVSFLRTLGYEVLRVDAILPKTATDEKDPPAFPARSLSA
jgi:predicted nuclease of predicted toxin-antitoxin system